MEKRSPNHFNNERHSSVVSFTQCVATSGHTPLQIEQDERHEILFKNGYIVYHTGI